MNKLNDKGQTVQERATELIKSHNGIRGNDLFTRLVVEYIGLDLEIIMSIIAYMVDKGLIKQLQFGPDGDNYVLFVPSNYAFTLTDKVKVN